MLKKTVTDSGCRSSLLELCLNPSYNYKTNQNQDGETLLHIACRSGHLDIVRALIEIYHCPLTLRDKLGNSPCHSACEAGQLKIMDYFDKYPYSLFYPAKNDFGSTLLHMACKSGSVPLVRMIIAGCLVKKGYPIKFRTMKCNEYQDEIFSVAKYGSFDMEKLPHDLSGNTPLHVACSHNHIEVVKFFFNEFQNTCKQNLSDLVPSLIAMACEQKHYILMSYLNSHAEENLESIHSRQKFNDFGKRHGFQVQISLYPHVEEYHKQVLHGLGSATGILLQEEHPLFLAARRGNQKLFDELSHHIYDSTIYSKANTYGDTILHAACVSCNYKLVKDLYDTIVRENHLKIDELINITNYFGYTFLHLVCEYGSLELVQFFVHVGCSVTAKTNLGHTPLHLSIIHERKDVFDYLMKNDGVDVNAKSHSGETPLHIATSESTRIEYVRKIVKHGKFNSANEKDDSDETPLFNACRNRSMAMVDILVEEPANSYLSAINNKNESIAHIAMRYHWKELLDRVLCSCSDPQHKPKCSLFEVAYHCDGLEVRKVAKSGVDNEFNPNPSSCIMIAHLMDNKEKYSYNITADINIINPNTCLTPLQQACRYSRLDTFKQFLSIPGCDCDIKGKGGNTVLHICCEMNLINFALLCIDKCSLNIRNKNHDTPLHVALENKNYELIKCILNQVKSEKLDNYVNRRGTNILHIVAAKDETNDILKAILSKGCIDHESKHSHSGDTALHIACQSQASKNIRYLFELEYDKKSWYNKKCESPLYLLWNYNAQSDRIRNVFYYVPSKYLETYNMIRSDKFYHNIIMNEPVDMPVFLYFIYHYCSSGCSKYEKCPDSEKNVIQQFVDKPSFRVVDSQGNTIFHYLALCKYHSCQFRDSIDKIFHDHKDLLTERNEYGDSALDVAAQNGNEWMAMKIIDCGVPLDFIDKKSSHGRVIQNYIRKSQEKSPVVYYLIAKGAQHNIKSDIKQSSQNMPTLHIAVVGNSGVGKTTIINSLKCLNDNDITDDKKLTIGVVPTEIIREGQCYRFYDFAGQIEFETGHAKFLKNLLFSASVCSVENALVFLVMVNGTKKIKENEKEIIKWLNFAKLIASGTNFSVHAMLLCSHADCFESDENKTNSIKKLTTFFSENKMYPLKLRDTVICMNCLNDNKEVVDRDSVKKLMRSLEDDCSSLVNFPPSSAAIELSDIITNNFSSSPCQLKHVVDQIKKDRIFSLDEKGQITMEGSPLLLSEIPELLVSYLEEIHLQNIIMLLKSSKDSQNWWIVSKHIQEKLFSHASSLFCRSPDQGRVPITNNTGVVPLSKLKEFFEEMKLGFEFEVFLLYLNDMEYCIPIEWGVISDVIRKNDGSKGNEDDKNEDSEHYFFPGLINCLKDGRVYTKNSTRKFFFGWIMKSKSKLGLDFLHTVLLRLTFQFTTQGDSDSKYDRKISLWKNGISWSSKDSVDLLVEVRDDCEVLFLSRGIKQRNVAKHTSNVIWEIRNIREELIKHNKDIPSLEEHCLLPPPQDYDSFNDKTNTSSLANLKKSFMEDIDCRQHKIENPEGEEGEIPLLRIDPFAILETEFIRNLRSDKVVPSESFPEEEYISDILKYEKCNKTDLSYSKLSSVLDKYSIFKGKELAATLDTNN